MTTDEINGVIKCYVGQGKFTDDPIETKGAPVVAKVPNLQKLMDHISRNGFEHHVAVNKSLCGKVLKEAFETYLNWKVYAHE
jgi:L-fucose isomerase-like protein